MTSSHEPCCSGGTRLHRGGGLQPLAMASSPTTSSEMPSTPGGLRSSNGVASRTTASGGQDGTVRLWDPRTSSVAERATGHRGAVNTVTSLAAAARSGTWSRALATGGEDGTVRWWHADTGAQAQRPGTRHAGPLTAATCLRTGDHPVLATAADDGTVRLWNPSERLLRWQSGRPLTRRRDDWVWTVATFNYIDRPPLLATAGIGSTVHLWQSAWRDWIRARTFGRPLSGQGYGIGVLASMPTADGGAMLASADEDGLVNAGESRTPNVPSRIGGRVRWPSQ
jgi:WD40 repeat protein